MPTLKGIKINLISQWELQIHPEFPHPDSSQSTFRSPNVNAITSVDLSPGSEFSDSKSDRILGRHSTVAVYVPSISGARFWLRYSITEATATLSPWYYFKLSMNGRHITSWGTNSATNPSGQVMRGLFDPSERWNYKDNGTVYKNNGTEVRPFFFAKEDGERSAGEDGGLIEVVVFRARGRKRRIPEPEDFRGQDEWGIVMPTGGLLDRPEDAKFYDWHLQDPKDKSFASFQFHYRSWDSLISLQLIPADYPRALIPASPSLLSLNGQPREFQESLSEDEEKGEIKIRVDEVEQQAEPRDSFSSNNSNTPWMTTIFEDSPDPGAKNPYRLAALFNLVRTDSSSPTKYTAIGIPKSRFSDRTLNEYDEDIGDEGGDEYEEPVKRPPAHNITYYSVGPPPAIPSRASSLNRSHHSRASSAVSDAFSITPSLRSYLDRDTPSPEPHEISVARAVRVVASTFGINKAKNKNGGSTSTGYQDVDKDPDGEAEITKRGRPHGGVFELPNVTLRENSHSSLSKYSPIQESDLTPLLAEDRGGARHDDDDDYDHEEDSDADAEPSMLENNTPTLSLTESEWMCRTPSPVHNDPESERFGRLWSPGVEKHSSRSSLNGNVLRKKAANIGVRGSDRFEDEHLANEEQNIVALKMTSGNWI